MYQLVIVVSSDSHSWFYTDLLNACVSFVCYILLHYVSKRYKLRKRDDIVPIHLFAEEFVEKEIREQQKFDEERASFHKWSTIVQ